MLTSPDRQRDDSKDKPGEEHDQRVGEARQLLGGDEGDEGREGPDAVVEGVVDPRQRPQQRGPRRDHQRQARPELDPLDHGHRDHPRHPEQQARGAEHQHDDGDYAAGGDGLALRGVRCDGGRGDGLVRCQRITPSCFRAQSELRGGNIEEVVYARSHLPSWAGRAAGSRI